MLLDDFSKSFRLIVKLCQYVSNMCFKRLRFWEARLK